MIIYVVGYGRAGSTALTEALEEKLNAVNLGEVKYLYRTDKDDLLAPYWISFKQRNADLLRTSSFGFMKYDSITGFFLRGKNRERKYCEKWDEIFSRMGLNPQEDIIIDSSKTPLDSFMRGIYLKKCFQEVLFIKPKRPFIDTIRSLLKGKNSNIERGERKSLLGRIIHTMFIGLPHLLITNLLTRIYLFYGLETIDLKNMETSLDKFFDRHNLQRRESSKALPMIYGNRSRLNK